MRTIAIISFALLLGLLFTSCEAVVHLCGHVYDAETGQPVEGVHVGWGSLESPGWEVRLAYDSLTREQRDQLRRARGSKKDGMDWYAGTPLDDNLYYSPANKALWPADSQASYEYHGKDHYEYYTQSYTDKNGHFITGPMLVGAVPSIPNIRAVFFKSGYKPTSIRLKDAPGSISDSFVVYMQRE